MTANEWFKFEQDKFKALGQAWSGDQLEGDMQMPPYEWLKVEETLMIPIRQSIIGGQKTVSTTTPGFYPDPKLYKNDDGTFKDPVPWMLRQLRGGEKHFLEGRRRNSIKIGITHPGDLTSISW